MALDHYVSQVHLRKFHAAELDHRLYAIRKSDLARFTPQTKDVCRIEEGSTNEYLTHDRAIEDFLKSVEPNYNKALENLRADKIDQRTIHTFAGFSAYVSACAPAAMRIHTEPLKASLQSHANILDRQGALAKAPPVLGGKSLTELLADGTVRFTVDEKFPQAIGISDILQRVSIWGNSPWEILHNPEPATPFFTSDFPVALDPRADNVVNRIVPLAPDLAIRIIPDVRLSGAETDLTFSNFAHRHRSLTHAEVVSANRLIVQCAEDAVFFCRDLDWIEAFVAKQREFRIEATTERIPRGSGYMNVSRQRIARRRAA